ncbi:MAG: hypothetical protein AAF483_24015, partial [Planctomycetota bacterium]
MSEPGVVFLVGDYSLDVPCFPKELVMVEDSSSPWDNHVESEGPSDATESPSTSDTPKGDAALPPEKKIQIGLRGLLFMVLLTGTGLGLLGKLYLSSPEIAIGVIGICSVVLPFLFAVFLLVSLSKRSDSPARIRLFAIFILISPPIGLMGTALLSRAQFQRAGPQGLAALNNMELLAKLPAEIDQPWVWDEYEGRLAADKLTTEEVDAALNELLKFMKSKGPN